MIAVPSQHPGTAGTRTAAVPPARSPRFVPAEGWSTLVLHLVVVLAAASTVELTPLAPARAELTALSLGGVALGFGLAKLRAPDLLAHLFGFLTGLVAAAWLAADGARWTIAAETARGRLLGDRALGWYRDILSGRPIDDPLMFSIVLGLTVWLVAYTSAWALYRRGWLATALLLPGIVAFVNLGFARDADALPLVVLIAAGCVLAARYHAFRRGRVWTRGGLSAPPRLDRRFLVAGINLALVAALLGWTLPVSARDGLGAAWDRLEQPWSAVQQRWDEFLGRIAGVSDVGGSYATFGNEFRLGGALDLSDEPVMIYRPAGAAGGPTYLIGHRYDRYDGHGWAAATADDRDAFNAQMTFGRDQGIHLSTAATGQRSTVGGTVEPIAPKGDMIFTRDTFLSADLRTNVQLSWLSLNEEPFDLTAGRPVALPIDLRNLARLLMAAAFDPVAADAPAGRAEPIDPALAAQVDTEVEALAGRFLEASWTVGADGRATTMVVSGELPVYDDVAAVFAAEPRTDGEPYAITGLVSTAPPDALRSAGSDYPAWVTDRYLQLPDTVTDRTRQLAADLAAGQSTRFDVALNVQDYVRGAITYDEDISPPPANQDVVDYVLFDSRRGYCEYYASAMTVLLRLQGIPSRVVAGYFPAPWDEGSAGYLYREKNAHLWVEAWFPGFGWIPFEPTTSQEELEYGVGDMVPDDRATPTPEAVPTPAPTPEAAATPAPATTQAPPAFPPPVPDVLAKPARAAGWVALGLLVLGLLAGVVAAASWQWRLRGLSPTGALYARAVRAGSVMGVAAQPNQTPREYADRLGAVRPGLRAPARLVADLYSQETYAGRTPGPSALRGARAAWAEVRRAMLDAMVRRRRVG